MNKAHERKLRGIKKILMGSQGYIRVGKHTYQRMKKRGYHRSDIVSCIMRGFIHEVQTGYNHTIERLAFNYVVTGKDASNNPIVVVLSEEGAQKYSVVTVMPPTDHNRFNDCIG
ncbi:DUF4258 domain-containing protein [Rossellomorea arthrocnemi]|uniref:DUF4258 domain-containing protein n=1 Tax=Rossellomorea arthrocnemi TaxID=2769542 RepID=UPI00191A1A70|nr:DUF4258 domain-containing protein [Rossellomorea arthrocnemi]